MQEAIDAYSETARVASSPRQLEASLLLKAASQLQEIHDRWTEHPDGALNNALVFNRRLWTVFISSMADEKNPLPVNIKNNVASLGAFILSHTLEVQMHPAPEKLKTLITINKEIAAGLRAA
jgi:flagellar biosynthesis activator protein FlaF